MTSIDRSRVSRDTDRRLRAIKVDYDQTIRSLWDVTAGGTIRSVKGQLVERMARDIVTTAWFAKTGNQDGIRFAKGRHRIDLNLHYLARLPDGIRQFISANKENYYHGLGCDVQVHIDDRFTLAVECKAYSENAMLKRILVDATLLESKYPELRFALFQLESMLGGDYSETIVEPKGSPASHTIMSYFDVNLNIVTLLDGERHIDHPIHKQQFYKPLSMASLRRAVQQFERLL